MPPRRRAGDEDQDGGTLRAVTDGLTRMASVSLLLGAVTSTDELAEVVVEHGLPALGARGGVVGVLDRRAAVLRLLRGTGPVPAGREVLALDDPLPMVEVATTGVPSLLRPADVARRLDGQGEEMHSWAGDGSWACSPMRAGGDLLGSVAATWAPGHEVGDREVGLLQVFTTLVAQTYERLQGEAEQRRQALAVRQMSETLQRSLLTQPDVQAAVTIAVRYVPAVKEAQIGGDWYDAFVSEDGVLTLAIGDISGHDRMAAAAMGQVRNLLRGMAYDSGSSPARLLTRLDAALRGLQLDTLATALVARLEQDEDGRRRGVRRLVWSGAGHLPALVRSPDGQVRVLDEPADLMLGVDPTTSRHERVVEVADGSTVLLYTDGLVERRDVSLDTCVRRLQERVAAVGDLPPERVCDALLAGMDPDEHRDDLALLVVRLDPS
ncbi:PP2C family protein-serine/threonine phosphatase [Aquipuribacter hungaricus]|uniref:PP2C family protein-serine/threonine phosphatase n=1 Tax=Aquipuribacter hungaricus TaxID=545624 RepID=A0ABV7WM89_9MICO